VPTRCPDCETIWAPDGLCGNMGLTLHGPNGTHVGFAPYSPRGHHMGQVDFVRALSGPSNINPILIPYNPSWAHINTTQIMIPNGPQMGYVGTKWD